MRLALISVTAHGAQLAETLACRLPHSCTIYAKSGRNPLPHHTTYQQLSILIDEIFSEYDGIVFFMATGIVVRVIANHLAHKTIDPAVVVLDEQGKHAISLLSGHIGGANELTLEIANVLGSNPVITTATDINNKPAVDMLAVKLNLLLDPFDHLKEMNAALVQGDKVQFYIDSELPSSYEYIQQASAMGIKLLDMSLLKNSEHYDKAVVITDKELYLVKDFIYLRPQTLAVGVGCRRDTPGSDILSAIASACRQIGRSPKSVAALSSTIVKEQEIGLLAVAQELSVPVLFYENKELFETITRYGLEESAFVREQIGVGNVCEAAALLTGKTGKLLLKKTKYPNVTVAIASVQSTWLG